MSSSMPSLACADCPVRDKAVCAALDPLEKAKLADIGRTENFIAGETIFAPDDERLACATLIEGVAKLSTLDESGTERIVALLHPAGFLGRLFATHQDFFVTAISDCRICLFPREQFEQVMAGNPKLTAQILRRTLDALEDSRHLIDLMGKRRAIAKVAGFLLMMRDGMCAHPHDDPDAFELPVSRGEMADMLGLTIETVSRQLGKLEKQGLIVRSGTREIGIADPQALKLAAL